jgi:hypothetical protein
VTRPSVPAPEAQKRLLKIWAIGITPIFLLLFIQTMTGLYAENAQRAWAWFFSTVAPTLSLAVTSMVAEAKRRTLRRVPSTLANLAAGGSIAYLFAVLATLGTRPLTGYPPTEWLSVAALWLGPAQTILAGLLGVVLVTKES